VATLKPDRRDRLEEVVLAVLWERDHRGITGGGWSSAGE
jgi:hypothetical protein